MRSYVIKPRERWLEKIAASGVILDHQFPRLLWNERCCVEVSLKDADAIHAHADGLYRELTLATDRAIEERHLSDFDFTFEEKRIIARSWEMSDYTPTLFTRLDYVIDQHGLSRPVGVSNGPCAGLIEAAVAQWDWAHESVPSVAQFNTISERLSESWREYHLIGKIVHFAYDLRDSRDINSIRYLWDSAMSAGVCAVALPLSALRINEGTGLFLDSLGRTVHVLIAKPHHSTPSGASLWTSTSEMDVCLIEPHWTQLWRHAQWASHLEREVLQANAGFRVTAHDSNLLPHLLCHVWFVAGKVSGLAFSRTVKGSRSVAREFVPHILDSQEGAVAVW